jgi:hypothetical protein
VGCGLAQATVSPEARSWRAEAKRTGTSDSDHLETFAEALSSVGNALVGRHSGANVCNPAHVGPRIARSRRPQKCHELPLTLLGVAAGIPPQVRRASEIDESLMRSELPPSRWQGIWRSGRNCRRRGILVQLAPPIEARVKDPEPCRGTIARFQPESGPAPRFTGVLQTWWRGMLKGNS